MKRKTRRCKRTYKTMAETEESNDRSNSNIASVKVNIAIFKRAEEDEPSLNLRMKLRQTEEMSPP